MSYKIAFLPRARKDFDEWKKTDPKTVEKIKDILRDIAEHPFTGIAKPEPLKNNLAGKWSRRINRIDRIIYSVDGQVVIVYIFSIKGLTKDNSAYFSKQSSMRWSGSVLAPESIPNPPGPSR